MIGALTASRIVTNETCRPLEHTMTVKYEIDGAVGVVTLERAVLGSNRSGIPESARF